MLDVGVLHKASEEALPSILTEGLRYGVQGNQDERVRATNELLNNACPEVLRSTGVDRSKCTYCYLGVDDGMIFDVESGRVIAQQQWDVGVGHVKLRIATDPDSTFVGDLDAYDTLLERRDRNAGDGALATLARRYWQRLVRLSDVRAHYLLEDEALVAADTAPPDAPRRLHRVEVLLTDDVPTDGIQQI